MLKRLAILSVVFAPAAAWAQGSLLQGGPFTAGHAPMYSSPGGSQAVVIDSGPAGGGPPGVGLSETLQVNRAPGTGPYGTHNCEYDNPITNPGGYHFLCFDANALGGALLAVGAVGGASPLPLQIDINGTLYPFPAPGGPIIGPSTTGIGDPVIWANATGTLLGDAGNILQYAPQTYQNTGFIPTNVHNVVWTDANNTIGAGGLYLTSGDQSQLTITTVSCSGSCSGGQSVGLDWSVNGTLHSERYLTQSGDTPSTIALAVCNVFNGDAGLIAGLKAFAPTNPYTVPGIGYKPTQGTCAQNVSGAHIQYDQPWAASGNFVNPVSAGNVTLTQSYGSVGFVGSSIPRLDGGPQWALERFIPGYTPGLGDYGPILFFLGQAGPFSPGIDAQLAAISVKWTAQNSNQLVLETQQNGAGVSSLTAGAGLYGYGLNDPGGDANGISNMAFANMLSVGPSAGLGFGDRSSVALQGINSMQWEWNAYVNGAPGSSGANGTTAPGNRTLHFANTAGISPGEVIADTTAPAAISPGTYVLEKSATTVTMSAVAAGAGVAIADTITFTPNVAQLSFKGSGTNTFNGLFTVDPGGDVAIAGGLTVGFGPASLLVFPGEIGFPVASGTTLAVGAAGVKFSAVCGTGSGTAKIIAYAGTSATPTTVVDNLGAGVTGC